MATTKLEKMSKAGLVALVRELQQRSARFEKLDAEASTHVESVICMRTGFTGEPPYVGWKGLGLALNEALDERDYLKSLCAQQDETLVRLGTATPMKITTLTEEDDVGC